MVNYVRFKYGHIPASFPHQAPSFQDPRNSGTSSTGTSKSLSQSEILKKLGIESTEFSKDEILLTSTQGWQLYSVNSIWHSWTVDLYLLHSPYLAKELSDLQQIWLSIKQVKASGKAKSIRVSNHQRPHIKEILKVANIIPALNQLEFYPYLQRAHNYLPWMRAHRFEAASFHGLTPITKARPGPLDNILAEIAAGHQVSENSVPLAGRLLRMLW
ncbi:uncharacterized protein EAE97_011571 [Botrytis byssoidea]|uniref:NADP-dependent oxidoreductase domain-containing protein n=1 Tax=Botrytis byssoidea TaxID=139641 RepID=A0A9P5HQW0_9HELO|nr:uncharacterized protein EAE97_011571 [Botrytis byssoidea]KAF7920230.1 hypothetical protein EAE97_011571 [Botrytis byssoidea]